MTEAEFERLSVATLARFAEMLERKLGDAAEVDFQDGILTVVLEQGGTYVINRHTPNRQIWLSSPRSGAAHYGFDAGCKAWIDTRSGRALSLVLGEELGPIASEPLVFD
ncbi:MAG: iron donor protein CyaY [Rhodospirillales bacterium]|nr:iron donor protein CyaY [Rhodospirillales bacterium]MSP79484.1 iron donor protein CyaY [Rhodospirillales bacterium]